MALDLLIAAIRRRVQMLIVLYFSGGIGGHVGILLTGLGKSSCFLHFNGSSYQKGLFARNHHVGYLSQRICIPSVEDGNDNGVIERHALYYWNYWKLKVYEANQDSWKKLGRKTVLTKKYTQEYNNCALFAMHLLLASCLEGSVGTVRETDKFKFKFMACEKISQGQFFSWRPQSVVNLGRAIRDEFGAKINRYPIFGNILECSLLRDKLRDRNNLSQLNLNNNGSDEWPKYQLKDNLTEGYFSGSAPEVITEKKWCSFSKPQRLYDRPGPNFSNKTINALMASFGRANQEVSRSDIHFKDSADTEPLGNKNPEEKLWITKIGDTLNSLGFSIVT